MRIDRLTVSNFKGFDFRTFEFHPRFNLLVGDNASGKSSVLEALAVAAGSWFLGLRVGQKSPGIKPDQVRAVPYRHFDSMTFELQFPVRIAAEGVVLGMPMTWVRELTGEGSRTTAEAASIKDAAAFADKAVRENQPFSLPLICFYGTERLWFENRTRKTRTSEESQWPSRFDGYRDCFDFTIQESALIEWIRDQATASTHLGKDPIALSAVNAAIQGCVEGAKTVYYDGRYKDLVVVMGDQRGSQLLKNLSDGQRIMLTMVGDLARRAATLNPHLGPEAVLAVPGVVIIDELDLHLHPKWQRRVIADLKNTFPGLQFITTTHSPQLIGEALPEEILILDDNKTTKPSRSYGLDSSRVVEEVMGAPSRDEGMSGLLSRLSRLIEDKNFAEAEKLVIELEQKLGPDDPEVTRARSLMDFLTLIE